MNELLASARAVHFAATIWLFGELVLACALSNWRGRDEPAGPGEALRRRLPSVARWSIAIGIASAVAWLAAVAATMSGMPLSRAIDASTLVAVVGGTLFGKVWIARVCLACVLLLALRPRSAGRSGWGLAFGPSLRARTWHRSPGPGTPPPPRGRGAARRSSPT